MCVCVKIEMIDLLGKTISRLAGDALGNGATCGLATCGGGIVPGIFLPGIGPRPGGGRMAFGTLPIGD